jgi:hypothetical protein
MELTLYRDRPVSSTPRTLPATVYNLARALVARSPQGCVFVPVRGLQYLAVIDREEFVFVDSCYPNIVAISWADFRPQARDALDEPVPYRCFLYGAGEAVEVQRRLSAEFAGALRAMADKEPQRGPGRVIAFGDRGTDR